MAELYGPAVGLRTTMQLHATALAAGGASFYWLVRIESWQCLGYQAGEPEPAVQGA